MGVRSGTKERIEGLSYDEGFASALRPGEAFKLRVGGGGQLKRKHAFTGFSGIHTEIMTTRSSGVNTYHQSPGLPLSAMDLGTLIRTRREAVAPKLSQAELGRHVGVDQRTISNIESGVTKTIAPDVANRLVGVLPVTMYELLRAMGYQVPQRDAKLDETLLEDLERAPEHILSAVRLLLDGWLSGSRAGVRADLQRYEDQDAEVESQVAEDGTPYRA